MLKHIGGEERKEFRLRLGFDPYISAGADLPARSPQVSDSILYKGLHHKNAKTIKIIG